MTVSAKELSALTDWEHGLISPKIFSDQEIYDAEMEALFGRAWLFLAHESMLQKPGDFFSTFMGADPVLVIRQTDGTIKALLNACRHRGMKVCRADYGNIKAFTCTYHGWTYDTSGKLVNVPNLEDGYYNELETDKWGLVEVPQVQSYKGLIFANFDEDAPPLIEYLGDMAWYLDALLDRREGGTEVTGSVHKITFKGNWKLAAEQFAGDTYHAIVTHASAFMARSTEDHMLSLRPTFDSRDGRQYSSRNGHGAAGFQVDSRSTQLSTLRARGMEDVATYFDRITPEIEQRLGATRAYGPRRTAATVFPNFSYLADSNGQSSIGIWHPKSPDSFEAWRWTIVDSAATPEEKMAQSRTTHVWPLGLADADDGENWSEIGKNIKSPQVSKLKFNYQMGVGHERDDDPNLPGRIGYRRIGEVPQRGFYRRWLEFMTSQQWPKLESVEFNIPFGASVR